MSPQSQTHLVGSAMGNSTIHNFILLTDAYKASHARMYMPGTTKIYSYLESRGGESPATLFFGLQYILEKYFVGEVITKEMVDEAEDFFHGVFGSANPFDRSLFNYIVDKYGGKLPLRIRAVPEGLVIPTGNVLMTIENTDPNCFWLTNYVESLLLQVWYPTTVATLSHNIKNMLLRHAIVTSDDTDVRFSLNDFGFRGVSSVESAAIGGAAHLLSFYGSDNLIASQFLKKYYDCGEVAGKSIPATEHSICSLLGREGEAEVYRHLLESFPQGTIACVSDSFNIFHACDGIWGMELRSLVLERDGILVIRPDSGDPLATLHLVFKILFERFGFSVNTKGYKVLNEKVRIIQGDGVNFQSINKILYSLMAAGIASENISFGMGGALLQKVDRDTHKFAIKCSYAERNGKGFPVQKSPVEIDESGFVAKSSKTSKSGRLKLVCDEKNGYETVSESAEGEDVLRTVFENGNLLIRSDYEELRKNSGLRRLRQ